MPQPDAITVLVVKEQAEEIKLITISLRAFYPGCRIEAIYSAEEALEWAAKQDWHVIILDERLPSHSAHDLLQEIRRRAPRSAIIVEMEGHDSSRALLAMRRGADYCIFKQSPVFLTELPLLTREVIEKRDLRTQLALSHDRYQSLVENVSDVVYELDVAGRFVYISPAVRTLLGYEPQEVMGRHYSALVHPDDFHKADRRFNERRTGQRATRRLGLRLIGKSSMSTPVDVEINAAALYNAHRQFLGTTGVVRPMWDREEHEARLRRLAELTPPLTTILANAQHLLHAVQDLSQDFGLRPPPAETMPTQPKAPPLKTEAITVPHAQTAARTTQDEPFLERRQSPRFDVQLEVQLRRDGTTWEGTALNIGPDGLYIAFKGPVDVVDQEPLRLLFTSEVSVLEIFGLVRGIRTAVSPKDPADKMTLTGLGVHFSALEAPKAQIFKSLLEGLRTRSCSVILSVILTAPEPEQISHSRGQEPHRGPHLLDPFLEREEVRATDRRLAARVNLALPVHMEGGRPASGVRRQDAHLVNLSTGGACIRFHGPAGRPGETLRIVLVPDTAQPSIGPAAESFISTEVIWTVPDTAPPITGLDFVPATFIRAGIRFVSFQGHAEQQIAEILSRYLYSPDRLVQPDEATALCTEFLECRNERGQRIALAHDYPRDPLPPGSPFVVLSPNYGETKHDYISLAYYLARNGFHVLRYDHTNHIGESEGGMIQTTLTGMNEDLQAVLHYTDHLWPASPITIIAAGLAGRVVLKVLAQRRSVRLCVLLAGVVDVQSTLMAMHEEDLIGVHLQGSRRGVSNIMGFNIDADRWLADATREEYADLHTTLADARRMKTPVIMFSSEKDTEVRQQSLKEVKSALREYAIDWYLMPESLHQLQEVPDRLREVTLRLVRCCRAWFYPLSGNVEIIAPAGQEVDRQTRLERERVKNRHPMVKADNSEFWRDYLDQTHYIVNFADYWHLMDHIYRLICPLERGGRILDAGCGNGNFGMFLLINESFRRRNTPSIQPLRYIGLDFISNGLSQAKINLRKVVRELGGPPIATRDQSVMNAAFIRSDLDLRLPFSDNQFDRVICNLVVGYVRDPLFTLRELMRVLSPEGKLILTNFKPQADLAQIYRNFISVAKGQAEIEKAKQVLNTSGNIVLHERQGIFRFFERQELAMLLMSSGAIQPRIYSTFANQAYIAVAEKPDLANQAS